MAVPLPPFRPCIHLNWWDEGWGFESEERNRSVGQGTKENVEEGVCRMSRVPFILFCNLEVRIEKDG